ncbi:type IA DNA topoisomerase [Peribacillus kribbensis]|uniref:type IA DNA topoisomerase n=1 Tax=Peribacillus kribbensis TaxID=356658 RepID=UPI00042081A2|nr:type IA DNA topoisomerase [Peribacillus kribbensis]
MVKVIIAEKPSVAKNIADALKIKNKKDGYFEGQDYIITWAFGHLLQLFDAKDYDEKMAKWKMENFPFIPGQFKYKVKSSSNRQYKDQGAAKQLKTITSLIKRQDVDGLISACDYDREGQIIGDTIIDQLRTPKKVYRLLLNEWTPEEVLKGLSSLRPNSEMAPLKDAGISRQWADWIIGINLTSVATLKYQSGRGKAMNVGRVLMPTLKIIYDRDKEIDKFVPETYYKLSGTFETGTKEKYEGIYHQDGEEKFKSKDQLLELDERLKNEKNAIILDKKVEKKREFPPYLFNLSGLQGYITSKYKGWTSDKVLKTAQSLYEKKHITYPRTSSIALEESLKSRTARVLEAVKKGSPFEQEITFTASKRIFDNTKVESHSAIIPTYLMPKKLSENELIVYTAIKNRFLMQFMPVAEYEETKITTGIRSSDWPGVFLSKGRVQLVEGWKKLEQREMKEVILPQVQLREPVELVHHEITEHSTTPPKPHTERTLLRIMETCGKKQDKDEDSVKSVLSGYSIGTAATRAETIKKLIDVGYIEYKHKNLICTDLGRRVVETLPVDELFDLDFTGRLEKKLHDIEKKSYTKQEFLQFIKEFTYTTVQKIKQEESKIISTVENKKTEMEVLGKCPVCGHAIIEGQKGFGCSNWKSGCKFVIWKNDKYLAAMKKKPTKTMVKSLLKNGRASVKGLTSKKGKKFNAILSYEKNPDNPYFSWKMEFEE